MASDDVQTNLRFPSALKERLTAEALKNGRSLSAEVTVRLQQSLDGEPGASADALSWRFVIEFNRLAFRLGELRAQLAALDSSHRDHEIEYVRALKRAPESSETLQRQAELQAMTQDVERLRVVERDVVKRMSALERVMDDDTSTEVVNRTLQKYQVEPDSVPELARKPPFKL